MKAFIATPLIDGRADREFINGLIACHGLYHAWACIEGQSHISVARDLLAAQFFASDCERLVFIDGDIGFTRSDLERLLAADQSIVSGLYPKKNRSMSWSFTTDAPPGWVVPSTGLIAVKHVPCGFLSIERRVMQDLVSHNLCPPYTLEGQKLHHFFQSGVRDGVFLSEDYYFCQLARECGYLPYIDPAIRLRHIGRGVYERTN